MKIGIMQPYFMPYIGYWQLIGAVDKFVILDDVNYIMRGFINRNSILLNGEPYRFTLPVEKASQNKLIKETALSFTQKSKMDFLKTICNAYRKSPHFEEVMPLLTEAVNYEEADLTEFIRFSIEKVIAFLHIDTEILLSSQIDKDNTLKAEKRIIEICKALHADTYINPCGGRALYSHSDFEREGIDLFFLETKKENIIYNQNQDFFVENLSIIDVLMYNDIQTIRKYINEYELQK